MNTKIEFTKVSGAGNDFIIINDKSESIRADWSHVAAELCSRHSGVGADGLLVLGPSEIADFKMLYFNADGSYGGMCGNGGRCIARYAFLNGIAPEAMTFEALDFVYHARILGVAVSLTMKDSTEPIFLDITSKGLAYHGYFIDTGAPHFIQFVTDVEGINVQRVGRELRLDHAFQPEGANIDFVQVVGPNSIRLRTYERGVEAETLACGTGAVASALVSALDKGLSLPVTVHVRSGEELKVEGLRNGNRFSGPTLEGSAHIVFVGNLLYDSSRDVIVDLAQMPLSR